MIFVTVVVLNLYLSWRFLTLDCRLDLAGDEAQYWTWSRHLAAGYYSKGPLVAWVIRASCVVLGNTMPAVRLPALLLAAGTSFCTYWLTRFLFASDRLALAAFVLGAIVPMFAAGGTLMTIDPPLFFCWAAATCLVAKAVFDDAGWAWPAAGVMAGLGVLTKYGMLVWPPLVVLFLAADPAGRQRLATLGPWVMVAVTLACLTPPLVWNAHHGWVTFQHVATQVGGEPSGGGAVRAALGALGRLGEYVGLQVAVINPALAVFVVAGVVYTLTGYSTADPYRRQMRFLLTIGGGMWVACALDTARVKVQVNWPAPAYFTLLILTAHFIATRWHGTWKPWRGWFWGAIVVGLIASTLLHDVTRLYPLAAWADRKLPTRKPGPDGEPRRWLAAKAFDPGAKCRGIRSTFAPAVADGLAHLRPGAFVLCEDYMDASQLSFYLPGQPQTYFAGSYWTDEKVRRRWTQFDLWPDRQLDRPEVVGHDAVYVGWPNYAPLRQSFESVTKLPDVVVAIDGLPVRTWTVYRCVGFKGMRRPEGPGPR